MDPGEIIDSSPLQQFMREGRELKPGQLIHVYPPLCTKEASSGISVRAVPTEELTAFHADFAGQIADLPDGSQINFDTDSPQKAG